MLYNAISHWMSSALELASSLNTFRLGVSEAGSAVDASNDVICLGRSSSSHNTNDNGPADQPRICKTYSTVPNADLSFFANDVCLPPTQIL